MTPNDFCYWLQGFVELTNTKSISEQQWTAIKNHLKLVFEKVTPDVPVEDEWYEKFKEELDKMDKINPNPYQPVQPYQPVNPLPWTTPTVPWYDQPIITCENKPDCNISYHLDTKTFC